MQKGNFEIGGILGMPSGLNTRYWFTESIGLDASAGISAGYSPVITADALFEKFSLYNTSRWGIRFFFGFGSLLSKEENLKFNLRIPVGLSFPVYRYPVNFSVYTAPAVIIKPEKEFDVNWGAGVRYNYSRAIKINRQKTSFERQLGKLERNVESLQYGLDKTKDKLARTEGELSASREKLDELTGRLENIKRRLDMTEGELDKTKSKLSLTVQELDSTKEQLDDVNKELKDTKKTLDDKQTEIARKQAELDKASDIIQNAFTGEEKKEEERKIVEKQKLIDKQLNELIKEKEDWNKLKEKENQRRAQLKSNCEQRGGVIDENGYCVCPENKEWDKDKEKCVCEGGYNSRGNDCEPCEIIKYNGDCADGGCDDDEKPVKMKKGPHKYVCIKKCRKPNEVWSKSRDDCVCRDGYYRDGQGNCVPRQ